MGGELVVGWDGDMGVDAAIPSAPAIGPHVAVGGGLVRVGRERPQTSGPKSSRSSPATLGRDGGRRSLGSGQIGAEAYAGPFPTPAPAGVPMVVETPSRREDVAFLKSHRAQALAHRDPSGLSIAGHR